MIQSIVPKYGYFPLGKGLIVCSLVLTVSKGILNANAVATPAKVAENLTIHIGPKKKYAFSLIQSYVPEATDTRPANFNPFAKAPLKSAPSSAVLMNPSIKFL
jgi:hypothetical protein